MRLQTLHRILFAAIVMAVLAVPSMQGTEVGGINWTPPRAQPL